MRVSFRVEPDRAWGRMLQEAWVKEIVGWEGWEAENQPRDVVGQLSRHNFPCRLPGTREPKRSLP